MYRICVTDLRELSEYQVAEVTAIHEQEVWHVLHEEYARLELFNDSLQSDTSVGDSAVLP